MTTPLTLGVDLAIVLGFLMVAAAAFRQRDRPGAAPFAVLAVCLAAMTASVGVARSSIAEDWATFLPFVPFVFASVAWVALAFEYTGRGPVVTRRVAGGLAAFGVVVLASTVSNAFVPDSLMTVLLLLVNLVQLALIAAIGYGAVLVGRSAVDYGDLSLGGSISLAAVGGGLVAITVLISLVPPLPLGVFFAGLEGILGVIAVLLLVVQLRYRVFETGASAGHLARESVLDQMSAAVAITGRNDRLLDYNRTARRAFDLDQSDALGAPVADALGFDPNQSDSDALQVETSDGRREFELERSDLTGQGDETVGRAYILRDVTERRTHEQQLDVLNRVLRHNLRNDLDAVRGFAETMELDDANVDSAALAGQIRATATDVADLGATLSAANRLLDADQLDFEPLDVGDTLEDVAASVGERYPEASISVTTEQSSLIVRSDREVFETALEETVQNGVEHNETETPHVELAAHRRKGDVVIEVRDDGPGIPERERAVLLEGEERPLRHGTGLGLWLVYWAVTRLGGSLAFRERDPRGSTVSIRIPAR